MSKRKQTRHQMFKKLPQELLTEANEMLQQEVEALRKELWVRSAPRVAEIMTALGQINSAAEHGDHTAKALLHEFFIIWRQSEQWATMIDPSAKRPEHFEAPVGADPNGKAVVSDGDGS